MASDRPATKRTRRPPKPLDGPRLEELALAYVARFATSAAKLERYLGRKLRERGWEGESEPDLTALVTRYAALGYVDDHAFAEARSGSLLRRGYGPRRIGQALGAAGIDAEIRERTRPDAADERRAALAFARRRGLGPFGSAPLDRARREKQIAAMLRAGHTLDSAREMVDAASVAAAEQWAAEIEGS
jgi:regulatory protein